MTAASNSDGIVGQSAVRLAHLIAHGEVSASEVVEAHIQRIEQLQPKLNPLAVPLFEHARREAQTADARRASGQSLGPLHGVPITIKEMFDVAGTATTVGLPTRADHRAIDDAVTVARLRRAGAIVLGKTNVPQLGMVPDADNPLYGRTRNPWNTDRTPGGSSGGEAAIIAAAGSPLGLGSDGGGSIRQPAHSCGICGLKPTGRRLSIRGHWFAPNWSPEWVQPGPMARSVDDLALAIDVLQGEPEDPTELDANAAKIPDYRRVDVARLRIGCYTQLGWLEASPAIVRAVETAAQHLAHAGAQIVPFHPPDVEHAWSLYMAIFYADALSYLKQTAKGNRLDWRIRKTMLFTQVPGWLRPLMAAVSGWLGQRAIHDILVGVPKRICSAADYFALMERQQLYRHQFRSAMDAAGIDALIGPPTPVPAVVADDYYVTYALMYTGLFNLLALPAGVVPATRVRADEQQRPRGKDFVERGFARVEAGSAGLPVGVHVAARYWREDVVLAVMKQLEESFRQSDDYPHIAW